MTPEAQRSLEKADNCLTTAGRNAYLAAFHAARALIFERTGKVAKTHRGVHR